jgi:predicted nucleic acid-binding Zn ribbon protein
MIEPTGYCWKCGHSCPEGELFCNKKCEQIYYRNIERQTKQGKKAGYGVTWRRITKKRFI